MNPEQLWDTTINPATRRLIQVRIEDALAASDIFVLPTLTEALPTVLAEAMAARLPIIASRHLLHTIVGVADRRPGFVIHEHEVERLIEVPLARLQSPAIVGEARDVQRSELGPMIVPYYDLDGARVWGATAMVLAEFLEVLVRLKPDATYDGA